MTMSNLIRREDAINTALEFFVEFLGGAFHEDDQKMLMKRMNELPSAELEMVTIEELSNQLGCATIQSALYWFEFLKTLDLLGFAIIRKETK